MKMEKTITVEQLVAGYIEGRYKMDDKVTLTQ
jgi:hypothetical protein